MLPKHIRIKKKYVTFEQAKKLYEHGFVQETEFVYDEFGNLCKNNESFLKDKMWFAPEQWLAIEWISNTFDAEIEARPVRYAGEKTSCYDPTINCCTIRWGIPPQNRKGIPQQRESAISSAIDYFFENMNQYLIAPVTE